MLHVALDELARRRVQQMRAAQFGSRVEQGENVLQLVAEPECAARLPQATGYDVQVIVLCSEGYTSSLAADSLRSLGLHSATDVIGGFRAWAAAGLPTRQTA